MSEERSIYDVGNAGINMLEQEIVKRDAELAQLRERYAALSLMIGEQNTTIGYQDAMLARLNERQFAAFTLIGRLDYFLETYARQSSAAHKKQAAQLRREIDDLTKARTA